MDDASGTAKVRLPKGVYLAEGDQYVPRDEEHTDTYLLLDPNIVLTGDKTVVFDARTARPVSTTVPRKDAQPLLADIGYERISPSGRQTATLESGSLRR